MLLHKLTLTLAQRVRSKWLTRLKAGAPLARSLLSFSGLVVGRINRSWAKVIYQFAWRCRKIQQAQGVPGLAKYLKASSVMLSQALAGEPHKASTALGPAIARTHSGIPRIIPAVHRARIRSGEVTVLRLWLSLLGLYRVLSWTGTFDISTITTPGKDISQWEAVASHGIPEFLRRLTRYWRKPVDFDDKIGTILAPKVELLSTSGPNSRAGSPSMASYLVDALTWTHHPVWEAHQEWLNRLGAKTWLETLVEASKFASAKGLKPRALGKLGIKEEPGKVRVFAMVDCWTQWLLKPLHNLLFDIMRKIPQDGTFNQMGPIGRLLENYPNEVMYSFDLSAATDRLPVSLQRQLLNELLPMKLGDLWASILCGRKYYYDLTDERYESLTLAPGVEPAGIVSYAVGQPMGAYSSWGMLALTHHYIVQWAAMRVGFKNWFSAYAVLGDDVVIANREVALCYLELMDGLGVKISLPKTLKGQGSLEFAKRFIWKGQDASPVSLLEYAVSQGNLTALVELVRKLDRNIPLRLSSVLRAYGFGYRVFATVMHPLHCLKGRIQGLLIQLSIPGSGPWASTTWSDFFAKAGWSDTGGSASRMWQHLQDALVPSLVATVSKQLEQLRPKSFWSIERVCREIAPLPRVFKNQREQDKVMVHTAASPSGGVPKERPLVDFYHQPSVLKGWWEEFIVQELRARLKERLVELEARINASKPLLEESPTSMDSFQNYWELVLDLSQMVEDIGQLRDLSKRAADVPRTQKASKMIRIFRRAVRIAKDEVN